VQTERSKQDAKTSKWFSSEHQNEQIVKNLEQIAREKDCSMSAVAMAWLLKKGTCPIVGLNSLERIENAGEALVVDLSDEDVKLLESPYRSVDVQAI
jgi:aryl-alcohol dehydrogenase-like predicted oxidoreductase